MKLNIEQFKPCASGLKYYNRFSSLEEFWNACDRGGRMLRLAAELNVDDRVLTRAKALCADTVRHLMKDERSRAAINGALMYADGKTGPKELKRYADYAKAAYRDAKASEAAAHAAYAANWDAHAANWAAHAANWDASYAAAHAAYAAYWAAHAANWDACWDASYAAAHAAQAAYCAAAKTAYWAASYAAEQAAAAANWAAEANRLQTAANAARVANRRQTANICREVLTEAVFKKIKQLNNKES